jgi:hypothetical protein
MALHPPLLVTSRRAHVVLALGWFALAMSAAGPARADGLSDPDQARAQCEQRGQAGTPAELKKCCGNLILVASMKQQAKLEAQCAAGSKPSAKVAPKSSSKPAKAGSAAAS